MRSIFFLLPITCGHEIFRTLRFFDRLLWFCDTMKLPLVFWCPCSTAKWTRFILQREFYEHLWMNTLLLFGYPFHCRYWQSKEWCWTYEENIGFEASEFTRVYTRRLGTHRRVTLFLMAILLRHSSCIQILTGEDLIVSNLIVTIWRIYL